MHKVWLCSLPCARDQLYYQSSSLWLLKVCLCEKRPAVFQLYRMEYDLEYYFSATSLADTLSWHIQLGCARSFLERQWLADLLTVSEDSYGWEEGVENSSLPGTDEDGCSCSAGSSHLDVQSAPLCWGHKLHVCRVQGAHMGIWAGASARETAVSGSCKVCFWPCVSPYLHCPWNSELHWVLAAKYYTVPQLHWSLSP